MAVGLTRRGKGTKLMVVIDGAGIPLGTLVASAQQAEVHLAKATLRRVRVPRDRWIVERTFAWLGNFRRLVTRWERLAQVYLAFVLLACIIISLRAISG